MSLPCNLLRSTGSRAATASEILEGLLMPALLTALTRNTYDLPSKSPVTGYLQTFTGASLHWTQLSVPTSHLQNEKEIKENQVLFNEFREGRRMTHISPTFYYADLIEPYELDSIPSGVLFFPMGLLVIS